MRPNRRSKTARVLVASTVFAFVFLPLWAIEGATGRNQVSAQDDEPRTAPLAVFGRQGEPTAGPGTPHSAPDDFIPGVIEITNATPRGEICADDLGPRSPASSDITLSACLTVERTTFPGTGPGAGVDYQRTVDLRLEGVADGTLVDVFIGWYFNNNRDPIGDSVLNITGGPTGPAPVQDGQAQTTWSGFLPVTDDCCLDALERYTVAWVVLYGPAGASPTEDQEIVPVGPDAAPAPDDAVPEIYEDDSPGRAIVIPGAAALGAAASGLYRLSREEKARRFAEDLAHAQRAGAIGDVGDVTAFAAEWEEGYQRGLGNPDYGSQWDTADFTAGGTVPTERTPRFIRAEIEAARQETISYGVFAGVAAVSLLVVTPVGIVVMGSLAIGAAVQAGRAAARRTKLERELRELEGSRGPVP